MKSNPLAGKRLYWQRMTFFRKLLKLNKTEFTEKIKPIIGYRKSGLYSKFEKEGIDLDKALRFARFFNIKMEVFANEDQDLFERSAMQSIIEYYQVKGHQSGFGLSGLKQHRSILKSLKGYWLEVIEDPASNDYSIGKFSSTANNFQYNGVSYNVDGNPQYSWNTVSMHFERDAEEIYYIYKLRKLGAMHNVQFGFGFLKTEYNEYEKNWGLFGGYYLNAEENTSPKNTLMFRMDRIAEKLEKAEQYRLKGNSPEDHKQFIQYLIAHKPAL